MDWLIDWHWEMIYFFVLWLELCRKPIQTALWNKLLVYCYSLPGGTKSKVSTIQLKLLVKHSQTSYNGLSFIMDSSFGGKDAITHTPLTSLIKDTSKIQLLLLSLFGIQVTGQNWIQFKKFLTLVDSDFYISFVF